MPFGPESSSATQARTRRPSWSQTRRLTAVLVLNLLLIGGLGIAGLASHSLGVLAAAGDCVADCLALALGIVAVRLRDGGGSQPFRRLAVPLVALLNTTLLLGVSVAVAWDSVVRLLEGSPVVHGTAVVVASAVTVIVMLLGAVILGRSSAEEDIHMRSVLMDAVADAAAAAGVAISGAIILVAHGLYWLDAAVALVLAVLIGIAACRLGAKAVGALRGHAVDFDDD